MKHYERKQLGEVTHHEHFDDTPRGACFMRPEPPDGDLKKFIIHGRCHALTHNREKKETIHNINITRDVAEALSLDDAIKLVVELWNQEHGEHSIVHWELHSFQEVPLDMDTSYRIDRKSGDYSGY